jgi:RloB-like protein
MPRDNHPRERQARALARKKPKRPPFDRMLIVTEGAKTEPLYFEDIRKQKRIASAHIEVLHSALGTQPRQVVDFAHSRFLESRAFECVFAVFDRDDHSTYADALARARALDNTLRNDARQLVRFIAVPTVPCFELWLLLHYQNQLAPLHRSEALNCLRTHIPKYERA